MKRPVTELDFRAPEFRDAKVEDYEFRDDGKVVRKDRWETSFRSIAYALGFNGRNGFELPQVVEDFREFLGRAAAAGIYPRNNTPSPESDSNET